MKKVLFLLNNAPNYRDKFLKELGKKVDLTVMSRSGKGIDLNDPAIREGYKYIELEGKTFLGINFNPKQFYHASKDFDVIIMGASLREPFLLLNLFRRNKKKILFGHVFNLSMQKESLIKKAFYKWTWRKCDSFLVHTNYIKNRLSSKTQKPIYSFNNTYFYSSEVEELPFNDFNNGLNLLWIGRYRQENYRLRNITTLIDIAKRNPEKVKLRLIGPGMIEAFANSDLPKNIEIFNEVFDESTLTKHFQWSHLVMNPGIVGLLVMNTARFGRPIIIDKNSVQGPEVQLAIDANQLFIDFDDKNCVDELINDLVGAGSYKLNNWGREMAKVMRDKYTLEYMLSQFLKAINN